MMDFTRTKLPNIEENIFSFYFPLYAKKEKHETLHLRFYLLANKNRYTKRRCQNFHRDYKALANHLPINLVFIGQGPTLDSI